jgi:hypothetical protein
MKNFRIYNLFQYFRAIIWWSWKCRPEIIFVWNRPYRAGIMWRMARWKYGLLKKSKNNT